MSNAIPAPITFPEIRIVEASAGSGKTYALAKRYVQLILAAAEGAAKEAPLRSVLAVTFTNKASIEMKQRIIDLLKKIAFDAFDRDEERQDIIDSLGIGPAEARRRAFCAMDLIIRHYHFFQVQTLDSFINALVSGCAFRLELSSRITIRHDPEEYLAFGLDELIAAAGREPATAELFGRFMKQYLYVEDIPGWFPHKNIQSLMATLYGISTVHGGAFITPVTAGPDDVMRQRHSVLDKIRKLNDARPVQTHKTFVKALEKLAAADRPAFDLESLSTFFEKDAFPVTKGGEITPEVSALWDAIRFELSEIARTEAYAFFNCYVEMFHRVSEGFTSRSRQEDVIFLSELNRQARRLFDDPALGVPELYYRLSSRYGHYLIDEFQDTSALQWSNLKPMVEEALASGGSLFYVGDRKQAIYRFRGGDADLFETILPCLPGGVPKLREHLGRNWRSQRSVVQFNNDTFSQSSLARFMNTFTAEKEAGEWLEPADSAAILSVFSGAQQEWQPGRDGGYVSVEHVAGDSAEERNELLRPQLTARITEMHMRFRWRDIAVLCRSNDEVELCTGWLMAAGIPVESDNTLNIRENTLVRELVSLAAFLSSPVDNVAFAAVITGRMYAAATAAVPGSMDNFIFEWYRIGSAASPYLYRGFLKKYEREWKAFFDELFSTVGYLPLYELMVSIIARFRVLEHFPGEYAFVMRFLELIRSKEEDCPDIRSFLSYFADTTDTDLYVPSSGSDAVRLLTVHKSKGLEFPAVVIPFFELRFTKSGRGEKSISYDVSDTDDGIALVRLNRKSGRFSQELRRLYVRRMVQSIIDELDTAYVAFTRARDELHIFVPAKAGNGINPGRCLLSEPFNAGSVQAAVPEADVAQQSVRDSAIPRHEDWIHLLHDEFNDIRPPAQRERALRGEAIHYCLSLLGNLTDADVNNAIELALEHTRQRFGPPVAISEVGTVVRMVTAHASARPFFFTGNAEVLCERELVDTSGGRRRVDRLILTDTEVIVVDFKSTPGDRVVAEAQVAAYMKDIAAIYSSKPVKGYVLYLEPFSCEEVRGGAL